MSHRGRLGPAVVAGLLVLMIGCTGAPPEPPQPPSVSAAPAPNCEGTFGSHLELPDRDRYEIHLDAVALAPVWTVVEDSFDELNSIEVGGQTYRFLKTGLPVRSESTVTISSADGRALVDWLDEGPQPSQRLGPCGPGDEWFVFGPGGIYVPEPGCYSFLVRVGEREEVVTIGADQES